MLLPRSKKNIVKVQYLIYEDDGDAGNVADAHIAGRYKKNIVKVQYLIYGVGGTDVAVTQVQEEHRKGAGGGERVRGTSRLQGCRGQPAPSRSTFHLSVPILGFFDLQ